MAENRRRIRTHEEERNLQLARQRYLKRYRRIDQNRRRGPQFLMVLLSLLVISLILYKMFGRELLKESDPEISDVFTGGISSAGGGDVREDPQPLQPEIEAFEKVLFGGQDADGLRELASSITLEGKTLAERLGQEDSLRLSRLGTAVDEITGKLQSTDLDVEQLTALREQWIDARDAALLRADWFSSPPVSISEDLALRATYRDAASSLLEATESARSDAESVADLISEGEEVDEVWSEAEARFSERLRDIELSIPVERPGTRAAPGLLGAIQKLETAIDFARERVAVSVPTYPLRPDPYDAAIAAAREALDAFDDLENP